MTHTRCLRLVFTLVVAVPICAAAQDSRARVFKGWGRAVDPDRDCQFTPEGNRLSITVPATRHDLSVEARDMNAPRVIRDVEGDFIIQVKVSGNVRHAGNRTSEQFRAYHGAGLLLWQDERTYIRLERAAIQTEEGSSVHYANFDHRQDGRLVGNKALQLPDQDTYLRLERRGNRVAGAVSPDGTHWKYLEVLSISMPRRVQVGVAAINTSTERFKATFSELELYLKEAG